MTSSVVTCRLPFQCPRQKASTMNRLLTHTVRLMVVIAAIVAMPTSASAQNSEASNDLGIFSKAQIQRTLVAAGTTIESDWQPTTQADWQRVYDDAIRRRDSGSKKMKIGAIMWGGGLVFWAAGLAQASELNGGGGGLIALGLLIDVAGTGAFIWGAAQRGGAREDMESLERLRSTITGPAGTSTGSTRRLSLGYRVSW